MGKHFNLKHEYSYINNKNYYNIKRKVTVEDLMYKNCLIVLTRTITVFGS
jgi:adenylylsulfate kinase-like enzyme